MMYKEIINLSKDDIKSYIESGNKNKIIDGLLSLFMNKIDKDMAIKYSNWAMMSNDIDIKKIGVVGMGHIARVYGLESSKYFDDNIHKLEKLNDKTLNGILEDVKDDFRIYIR